MAGRQGAQRLGVDGAEERGGGLLRIHHDLLCIDDAAHDRLYYSVKSNETCAHRLMLEAHEYRIPAGPLSLTNLRAFEAVARLLSFGAAAEELHLTQSAISRQIKGLEDELGAALFVRGTRHVQIAPDGQTLLRAVEPWLAKLDAQRPADPPRAQPAAG